MRTKSNVYVYIQEKKMQTQKLAWFVGYKAFRFSARTFQRFVNYLEGFLTNSPFRSAYIFMGVLNEKRA